MRKLLFGLFSLFILSVSAQSSSAAKEAARQAPDAQIQQYIAQAKAQGYSLSAVENILRAQGATYQDLARLSALWGGTGEASEEAVMEEEAIGTDFGLMAKTASAPAQTRAARFGASFFNRAKLTETPELYIATPADYQLGPGDELSIQLFGGSEEMYTVQISREGYIKVPRLAPVYLSGLSVSQAKSRIKNAFSKIYTGLNVQTDDPSKVDLMVSLRSARSVVINIAGNVQVPGTYTISAFSSVLNAIYAAGGPNEVGTYRDIKVIRNGKVLTTIDLYDYFLKGMLPTLYLKDQDIIQIPALLKEVALEGGFKTTGFFELKDRETLKDILSFSGGFLSNAYKDRVLINRIAGYKRETLSYDLTANESFAIEDGDVITANLITDVVENGVSIEGAVYLPGLYSLSSVSTLGDLLDASKGITLNAFPTRATLYRRNYEIETEALSVDIKSSEDLNIKLRAGDRLYIPSSEDLLDFGRVRVSGEVQSPGDFVYREGMSVSDLLVLADGLTFNAATSNLTLYRITFNESGLPTTTSEIIGVDENLIPSNNLLLQPDDHLVVRLKTGYDAIAMVNLQGEVQNKGTYALKDRNTFLYDVLEEAGGFLKSANLKGISISRNIVQSGSTDKAITAAATNSTDDEISGLLNSLESDRIVIGVDGEKLMASRGKDLKNNILLQEGDQIFVPKFENTITVVGNVQQNSKQIFQRGLTVSKAIRNSGGYAERSKKNNVYVVYQNGTIKTRKNVLGFKIDPRLEAGATVVVPVKGPKEGNSTLGEIVGYTSTLATLALLIKQLGI